MRIRLLWLAAVSAAGVFAACADDPAPDPDTTTPPQTIPMADAAGAVDAADANSDVDASVFDCADYELCSVAFPVSRETILNGVWSSGPTDVWAVGTRGTILQGDGNAFTALTMPSTDIFFAVWGSSKSDIWLVNGTSPYHSSGFSNGSATFTAVTGTTWNANGATSGRIWAGASQSASAVWIGGDSTSRFGASASLWELGDGGDGGVAWQGATTCAPNQFCFAQVRGVWGLDHEHAFAVGPHGSAYTTTTPSSDAGRWTQLDTKGTVDLYAVWGSSASDVWAVGGGGSILHLTSSWATAESPTTSTLRAIWGASANDIYAVGDGGVVIHYDGKAWKQASVGRDGEPMTDLFSVWGSGPDDVYAVGAGVILHRSQTSARHP